MPLSCFRRPARSEDRPSTTIRHGLSLLGESLRIDLARLAASTEDAGYWVVPSRDGERISLYAAYHDAGGSGCRTTLEHLRDVGLSAMIGVRRGRWRYALLVADGYERARAGTVEVPVVDNVAVLDLADRERFIEVSGPTGTRALDLGPSDGDELLAARTGPPGGRPRA